MGTRLVSPYPRGGAVTEAIMNAVEHGSQFGQNGNVRVTLDANQRGLLFTVNDNGNGFTPEMIQTARPNTETGRGNGLTQLKRCPALVSFGKIQKGFRVSIFYTLNH